MLRFGLLAAFLVLCGNANATEVIYGGELCIDPIWRQVLPACSFDPKACQPEYNLEISTVRNTKGGLYTIGRCVPAQDADRGRKVIWNQVIKDEPLND